MAVNSLEELMDVPVDHYISINMDGVKTVVDELGGVTITSNGYVHIPYLQIQKASNIIWMEIKKH